MKTNIELLQKYDLKYVDTLLDDEQKERLMDYKFICQSIVCQFITLENTLAHCVSPEESEMIDKTMNKLLKYMKRLYSDDKKLKGHL